MELLLNTDHEVSMTTASQTLRRRFQGVFSAETIDECLRDSYRSLAATATIGTWLPVLAERLAKDRLSAAARPATPDLQSTPSVLFLCVHNAGRSQIALGYFQRLAAGRATAWSAGSDPGSEIHPTVIQAMSEVGIDITTEYPKPTTTEIAAAADVIVTMGCGDACPILPGKRYLDWQVPDPAGQPIEHVRTIRDHIARQVEELVADIAQP